ncbi:MAG: hypothetical protein SFV55_07245 [Haliscomenobacter sp.]|uniref:hypothetical protein n=1 Tax=Haliscomenobacter sp. TaxID=2717303 RepID=UPI0029BE443F|nr:hypothetical protein [Haliscomenobacter sp.]MDX2068206.1 hypothetical protein [Haliscomenobacter sp.]
MSNVNIDSQLKKEAKAAFSEDEDMSKRDTGPKFKTPSTASSSVVEKESKKLGEELFEKAELEKRRRSGDWMNKLGTVLLLFVGISFFTSKDSIMTTSISYIINLDVNPSFKILPERDSSGTIPPTIEPFFSILLRKEPAANYKMDVEKTFRINSNRIPKSIQLNDPVYKPWIPSIEPKEFSYIGFSTRFFENNVSNQASGTFINTSVNQKLDLVDSLIQLCQNTWDELKFDDINNVEPLIANQAIVDSVKQVNSLRLIVDIDLLEYCESSHQNEYGEIQNTASIKYILKGIKPKTREVLFAEPIHANVTMEQPAGFDLEKANTPLYKCSPAMLQVKKQVLQKSVNYLKPFLDKL